MVYRQTSVYKFLDYCNKSNLEKKVVDCGAGGNMPPLGMFYSEGYETVGIEMDDNQIALSSSFEKENNMNLNIIKGDMRYLPFEEEEIPFIYSFGSIFHMKKCDIEKSLNEFKRVLKKDGLCYINLLSIDDCRYGDGLEVGNGEFIQNEYGEDIIHSYFTENEADKYFEDMDIIYKESRVFHRIYEGETIKQGAIDYIVKKR